MLSVRIYTIMPYKPDKGTVSCLKRLRLVGLDFCCTFASTFGLVVQWIE